MSECDMTKVAILGGSGYAALELIKILLHHPAVKIVAVTSRHAETPKLIKVHLANYFAGALLLPYEDFYRVWPGRTDNPFTAMLNNTRKYVASRTLKEPLPWVNSTLLEGDTAEAVAMLKKEPGGDLLIMGSGELVQSLMQSNVIDEYIVLIHPLVLGFGRRLFSDGGAMASLEFVNSKATPNGVVIATYQPVH
jgi:dihydrofolate reductase